MAAKNMSSINIDKRNGTYMLLRNNSEEIANHVADFRAGNKEMQDALSDVEIDKESREAVENFSKSSIANIDAVSLILEGINKFLNTTIEDAKRIQAKAASGSSSVQDQLNNTRSKLEKR